MVEKNTSFNYNNNPVVTKRQKQSYNLNTPQRIVIQSRWSYLRNIRELEHLVVPGAAYRKSAAILNRAFHLVGNLAFRTSTFEDHILSGGQEINAVMHAKAQAISREVPGIPEFDITGTDRKMHLPMSSVSTMTATHVYRIILIYSFFILHIFCIIYVFYLFLYIHFHLLELM